MTKNVAVILAVLTGLTVGCGRSSTQQTKDGEVKIERKGSQGAYEVTTKEGTVKVTTGDKGVALPDDFPKDVPVYKGATVKLTSTQGKATVVHLGVPVSVAESAKFYQDQLKQQGWEIEATMNMGEATMISAKKGTRKCTVNSAKTDKETMVQIVVVTE
jgi:hypothetical protein